MYVLVVAALLLLVFPLMLQTIRTCIQTKKDIITYGGEKAWTQVSYWEAATGALLLTIVNITGMSGLVSSTTKILKWTFANWSELLAVYMPLLIEKIWLDSAEERPKHLAE